MKILCITPMSDKIKTPETGFAELLSTKHDVVLVYTGYNTNEVVINRQVVDFKPDVIWGMMEYALPTALYYKKLTGAPLYSHIECIPPWRTGIDDPKEYGFDYDDKFGEISNPEFMKVFYKDIIDCFNQSDSRSISGNEWRYTFEKVTGEKLDADARYYTFNAAHLEKYMGKHKKKNQIFTISRFSPIKRIHHIIKALSRIPKDKRPVYKVIGYGEQEKYLKNLAKTLEVEVDFVGAGQDGIKEKIIQESLFGVQIFSGIPVIEAAFFGVPVISYDTPHMVEVYGKMATWTKTNDIEALSNKIEEFLDNPETVTLAAERALISLVDGSTNVNTNDQFIEAVEKLLYKAIEAQKNE